MYPLIQTALSRLWEQTTGIPEICLAVIDGRAEMEHPSLSGANLKELSIYGENSGQQQPTDHGTHVTSILFGRHGSPVSGIAPNVRGLLISVFELAEGRSIRPATQLDLARAINLAVEQGAHVINISAGELANDGDPDEVLIRALRQCEENNILVVAAAGNNGCRCLHVPAAFSSVLAIGACDETGRPLSESNWGDAYRGNGVLAPGQGINGAVTGKGYALKSGTSFATPIVSGIAALLLSIQAQSGRAVRPLQIRELLLRTAVPCPDPSLTECLRYLRGLVDIDAALRALPEAGKLAPAVTASAVSSKDKKPSSEQTSITSFINIKKTAIMENVQNLLPEPEKQASQDEALAQVQLSESLDLNHIDTISDTTPQKLVVTPVAPTPITVPAQSKVLLSEVELSCGSGKCSCDDKKEGGVPAHQKVYALGTIGYDFVSESRRDSFLQHINDNLNDPAIVIQHLENDHLYEASELIWTLEQEGTPIYAIHPHGAFAKETYQLLVDFMQNHHVNEKAERVAIPGIVAGKVTLLNGQTVPAVVPTIRGMAEWSTEALISAVDSGDSGDQLANFLERIYYEFRNFGVTPQERALNYAATNAFTAGSVFEQAASNNLQLNDIQVTKSPIVRPGVDGYDVQLIFFDPQQRYEKARKVFRYTVDVSDVVPVTIGTVRSWYIH